MAKAFEIGEVVLFQREAGARWEVGEYCGCDSDGTYWHWVRDDTGFRVRHYVPSRRIKSAPRKEEASA